MNFKFHPNYKIVRQRNTQSKAKWQQHQDRFLLNPEALLTMKATHGVLLSAHFNKYFEIMFFY